MERIRRGATVSGLVQGVSFRYHTEQRARRLGLTGWVRNAEDGSVRLEVQGDPDGVESLLDWLQTGPPAARVDDVSVTGLDPQPGERDFRVAP